MNRVHLEICNAGRDKLNAACSACLSVQNGYEKENSEK